MYSSTLEIYHHDVHTGWFYNHLTKALPCSFLWRHHLLPNSRPRILLHQLLPKTGDIPSSLPLFWLGHTPNQTWRTGAAQLQAASSLWRLLCWYLVLLHHAAALPGRHTRQVGLIASPPSCFEWCFSPSLFRCRDSKPWTGGGDLQAHHGWTGLAHPQAGGHQDAP